MVSSTAPSISMIMGIMAVYGVAIIFLGIIPMWRIFAKAGKPGWAVLVPIYNLILFCRICGRSGWWTLLCCIPLVNFIICIVLFIDLAKKFGKGAGFAVGLILLSPVFIPILGYGKSAYVAPTSAPAAA